MGDTKEAILTTALQLFAGNGYEAVSVSEIAGALGMTKGALYKHYKNKRDIFDHILIRMEQRDAEQAGNCEMPEGTLEEMEEQYRDISMEQFFTKTVSAVFSSRTNGVCGRSVYIIRSQECKGSGGSSVCNNVLFLQCL